MAHSEVKFKYVSKCKVCKIQEKDQELFNYLHTLRFRDNASLEHIASVAANKFIERGITLDPPNPMNLSTHFNRHTPLDLAAKYRAQNEIGITGNNTKSITEESQQHFDEIVKEKVDSYDEMERIYEEMNARFGAFDDANQKTITLQNLNGYVSFVRELRSLLVELHKIKQDEELALLVLNTALQQYTVSTLHGFLQELGTLKNDLRFYIKDPDSVERLVEKLQSGLTEHIQASSKSAIEKVKSDYKLH